MLSKSGYGSKNKSSHGGKGKPWGPLVGKVAAETAAGPTSGESHRPMKPTEFLGPTKGNHDLPIDRTSGVSTGHGGGPHKAGG